jgi:citrate lyase subunit alpha/citrate CoA-transferase
MSTELKIVQAGLEQAELGDGACLSFHHHLRDGDAVMNTGLMACAACGLRELHVAASSIFPVHAPLVDLIRQGVVTRLSTGFVSGPVARAISTGAMPERVRLQTHGGRAREIDHGELRIDAAFVAASAADHAGNLTGRVGPHAFGAMGYPQSDARTARHVVGVTDHVVASVPEDVPAFHVNQIMKVAQIGDPAGIASGTTRPAVDEASRRIGQWAAQVIAASGLLQRGFNFQTGAGGVSLVAARAVADQMARRNIIGDFASGGITGTLVEMLQAGLFTRLRDVQCFDLAAVTSLQQDPRHQMMSAAAYAGPHIENAVDELSAVILGAAEVDLEFNVNVTTGADGVLIGGSGGHADTAEGADVTVITTRLTAAGFAKVVPKVGCVTTPGRDVDVIVTDAGIAVNPRRGALHDRLRHAGLPLLTIEDLARRAAYEAETPRPIQPSDAPVVAESYDRHGVLRDVVRVVRPLGHQ